MVPLYGRDSRLVNGPRGLYWTVEWYENGESCKNLDGSGNVDSLRK